MTAWSDIARAAIGAAALTVPEGATLAERTAIIDAAYPFDRRAMWPYKAWLKARRSYLAMYGYRGRGVQAHLSPMERAMARSAG